MYEIKKEYMVAFHKYLTEIYVNRKKPRFQFIKNEHI